MRQNIKDLIQNCKAIFYKISHSFYGYIDTGSPRKDDVYLAEIFAHPLALSLAYLIFRHDPKGLDVFLSVMAVKYFCDIIMLRILRSDLRIWHYLLLPIKDVTLALVWFVPFFDKHIVWRGNRFTITKNTALIPPAAVVD